MNEPTGRLKEAINAIDYALDAMEGKFCSRDDINTLGYVKPYLIEQAENINRLEADIDKERLKTANYEGAITDVCLVINKVKCDVNYPKRKELCLELNKLCRLLRESHEKPKEETP